MDKCVVEIKCKKPNPSSNTMLCVSEDTRERVTVLRHRTGKSVNDVVKMMLDFVEPRLEVHYVEPDEA